MYIPASNFVPKLLAKWVLTCELKPIERCFSLGVAYQWLGSHFIIPQDFLVSQVLQFFLVMIHESSVYELFFFIVVPFMCLSPIPISKETIH